MKIAIEGCAHGELDKIYEALTYMESNNGFKVDLLICCGDFQAVRNLSDLSCMACPIKYREMNTFYKYYSGEKQAPILTLFIGGNHEASNYLAELSYGGWVCPNIYYLGYSNVVTFGGVRIAGLSGIYKGPDYLKGHFEKPPYNNGTVRSAYHVRNVDVFRLKQVGQPIDIFLSHDWPRGIGHHGDLKKLLRQKPFLRAEIENDSLGSRPSQTLLQNLKPTYWFAAHMHVKFAALVEHESEDDSERFTKFLALDKCLPRRDYMQILDVTHDTSLPLELRYDPRWLCVLRSTNHLLSVSDRVQYMPGPGCQERWQFDPTEEEMKRVHELFQHDFRIPLDFERTVVAFDPLQDGGGGGGGAPSVATTNPQTTRFCRKLNIDDPMELLLGRCKVQEQVEEVVEEEVRKRDVCNESEMNVTISPLETSNNPDELQLDDFDNDNNDCSTSTISTSSSLGPKAQFDFPEFIEKNVEKEEEGCCSERRSTSLKKFTRRNASIYSQKENEEGEEEEDKED